ncbi:viroplasmin family protein [Thermoanaerobacter uzonensis]|uniref:ribonuclease H1 domain-containing protein n=1 Tax=Thermoanaerobacter uzonensis TaxID=447593 RepID=UPI003D7688AF
MAQKKYYAVRKGRKIGIFETWEECKNSIEGYSGAEYKSFSNKEDAELYLEEKDITERLRILARDLDAVISYIDGSYSDEHNRYSFGCIFITKDGDVFYESGYGDDPEFLKIKNVAGEIQGAMYAVEWAFNKGYKRIIIKYDYEGIEKWYSGEWQAKNSVVKKYVEFMKYYSNLIDIIFQKVDGHSGDKYNEEADRLAGYALTGAKRISHGEFWITAEGIKIDDLDLILKLLKEDVKDINIVQNDEAYCKQYKITGPNKEEITVRYYRDKQKLLIQGKQQILFSILLCYVTELVDKEQVHAICKNYSKLDIKKENIEKQFKIYLPNAAGKLPVKIENVLYQAVYNLNIEGDMFDYSFLMFPVLRALEGFLKYILGLHGINCNDKFNMFEMKNNNTYKLSKGYESFIGSADKVKYINKLYNHYNNHRHVFFHWNDPCSYIDDTRLIYDINSARKIIHDTLYYIDEYFIIK